MRELNRFEKIMCSLGGADTVALADVPPDQRRRFFLAGLTNLLGSICSAMALGVALHAFGIDLVWLIPIVIFFGIVFFVLTMSLCGAIASWGSERSGARAGTTMALRLTITVLLSLFTAMILETMIFSDFLAIERREFELTEAGRLDGLSPELRERSIRLREEVNDWDNEISNWYAEINRHLAEDPIVLALSEQRNAFAIGLSTTSAQYQQWIRASADRIVATQRTRATITGELANLPADSERHHALNSQIQSLNANIAWENSEQRRRTDRLRQLEEQLASMNRDISQRRLQVEALHGARRQELYAQREMARADLAEVENRILNISEVNLAFAAMGGLIRDINLIRRIQSRIFDSTATPEQRSTALTITFIGVIIAGFFITIDLLPLVTLLYIKSEHYNFLKEKQQEEREILYTAARQERIDTERLRIQENTESEAVKRAKRIRERQNEMTSQRVAGECASITEQLDIRISSLHELSSSLSKGREEIYETLSSNPEYANTIARLLDKIQQTFCDGFEALLTKFDRGRERERKTYMEPHDGSMDNAA